MKKRNQQFLLHKLKWFLWAIAAVVFLLLAVLTFLWIRGSYPLWIIGSIYIAVISLSVFFHKKIWQPYVEAENVLQAFTEGYMVHDIFGASQRLSPSMEKTFRKLQEMLNMSDMVNASKEQAQYLALQNQINPHFLYNTLEGIRGETLSAGLTHVAKMTEALATFFRYTISNLNHLVMIEDELTNVNNYYIIQQYRFGDRLSLDIEYDEELEEQIMQCRIPKLTLQPIVENAIYHGIERKVGRGQVCIKIEMTGKRLIITVSDDGLGMDRGRLQEINQKLQAFSLNHTEQASASKGGIAIVNVNTRIKLLFGEEYGICMYSVPGGGTDVEITLPLVTGRTEERAWQKKS